MKNNIKLIINEKTEEIKNLYFDVFDSKIFQNEMAYTGYCDIELIYKNNHITNYKEACLIFIEKNIDRIELNIKIHNFDFCKENKKLARIHSVNIFYNEETQPIQLKFDHYVQYSFN